MDPGFNLFPGLCVLRMEWRDKETRRRARAHIHRRRMKGMLVMRHWDWILLVSEARERAKRAHGWYMSSLLLFYL